MANNMSHSVSPEALAKYSATKEKVLNIKKYLPGLLVAPAKTQESVEAIISNNITCWSQLPENTAEELWEKLQFVFATAYVKKIYNDSGMEFQYTEEMCSWCTSTVLAFYKMADSRETFKLSINNKVLEQFNTEDEKFEMYKQITRAIYSRAWTLFKHGPHSDAYMRDVLMILLMLTGQLIDTTNWGDLFGTDRLVDIIINNIGNGYFNKESK